MALNSNPQIKVINCKECNEEVKVEIHCDCPLPKSVGDSTINP